MIDGGQLCTFEQSSLKGPVVFRVGSLLVHDFGHVVSNGDAALQSPRDAFPLLDGIPPIDRSCNDQAHDVLHGDDDRACVPAGYSATRIFFGTKGYLSYPCRY